MTNNRRVFRKFLHFLIFVVEVIFLACPLSCNISVNAFTYCVTDRYQPQQYNGNMTMINTTRSKRVKQNIKVVSRSENELSYYSALMLFCELYRKRRTGQIY